MIMTSPSELPDGPARLPLALLALINAVIIGGLAYELIGGLIT